MVSILKNNFLIERLSGFCIRRFLLCLLRKFDSIRTILSDFPVHHLGACKGLVGGPFWLDFSSSAVESLCLSGLKACSIEG